MQVQEAFSFKINGIEIKSDSLYQVVPKPDLNAPDGFVKWETSKLLMNGIKESAPCNFNEYKKVWDTGFYSESPCYAGMPKSDVQTKVDILIESVRAPYEDLMGEGALDHKQSNNEFWDSFGGDLYNGKVYNTSDPKELLELYMAILHLNVVKPEDKSKHFASKAKYCIVNKDSVTSLKEEKSFNKAEAIGNFYTLLNNNKKQLLNVLEFIGVISSRTLEDRVLTNIVMEFFEDKKQGANNIKRFIETHKKTLNPKGKEELNVFAWLTELRRKRIITEEYGELYLDGSVLGGNLKDATVRVITDKDLKIKVAQAIEKEK